MPKSGKPQFTTYENYQTGMNGFDELSAVSNTSGSWHSVQTISGSCTFAASTASGSNFTSTVVPEGTTIKGWFTILNITAGSLLAHRQ
jgi:hypothetical protein